MPDEQPILNPKKNLDTVSKTAVVIITACLLVGGAAIYRYRAVLEAKFVAPCSSPITYRVDSIDNRFGISQDKFKQAILNAAEIWNKAAGRQLFQYEDNGQMPISLVYDNRQAATDQLKKLNLNLDSTQSSYDQLSATYKKYQSQYTIDKQKYETAKQQFDLQQQAYNQEVQTVNNQGGASRQEAAKLNAERDQLNLQAQSLNQQVASLNQEIDTINALAVTLNRIGSELNIDVSAYNSTSSSLSEFEEGVYTTNGFKKSIVIYQFDDYNMLVRVLAHELGHSLGMEHVDDPKAIMYKLNQSTNQVPTASDMVELKRACRL